MFFVKVFSCTNINRLELDVNKYLSTLNIKTKLVDVRYQTAPSINAPSVKHIMILTLKETE